MEHAIAVDLAATCENQTDCHRTVAGIDNTEPVVWIGNGVNGYLLEEHSIHKTTDSSN